MPAGSGRGQVRSPFYDKLNLSGVRMSAAYLSKNIRLTLEQSAELAALRERDNIILKEISIFFQSPGNARGIRAGRRPQTLLNTGGWRICGLPLSLAGR